MRITIVCVGKVKEKYFTGAIDEYSKRLSRYCKLEIIEVPDEKTPDGASEALNQQIKEKENCQGTYCCKTDAEENRHVPIGSASGTAGVYV